MIRATPQGTTRHSAPSTQPPTYPTSTPQAASGGRCRAGKEGSRESGLCGRADAPVRYWQPAPPPLRGVRVVRTALPAAGGPTLSALAAAGVAQVPVQEHTTTEWMGSGWHVCLRAACAAAESQPATSSGSTRHWLASWGAAADHAADHQHTADLARGKSTSTGRRGKSTRPPPSFRAGRRSQQRRTRKPPAWAMA